MTQELEQKILESIMAHSQDGDTLDEYHPADIAEAIDRLEDDERKLAAFYKLGVDLESEVLPLLNEYTTSLILEKTDASKLGDIIGEMDSDDAADILGGVDDKRAEDILDTVPDDVDKTVTRLMEFDEESAGGIMQTEMVSVLDNFTVTEAIENLRSLDDDAADIHNVFVTDKDGKLMGAAPITELILQPADTKMSELIEGRPPIYAMSDMDQEQVAELFKKYDLVSLPVVEKNMILIGRILFDDIIDVVEEEANEDIIRLAGADDEALTQNLPVAGMVKYRLPWLGASLIGGFITGVLIWEFRLTMQEALALAAFIPVVMGMSGNVGAQSSALVIRGMATGKVEHSSLGQYLIKEVKIGLALGLVCGIVAGVAANLWQSSIALGFVVGFSIFLSIAMAAFLGVSIPLFFRWAKIDPAIAGGPIVLAVNDISGLLIFFGVATVLINYLK